MRTSGILLGIPSLPSNYGIGTLGKSAYEFVDFLRNAKQTYWQILPIGPTSYGDSPYQTFSAFAGNPYFIDLDLLIEDNLYIDILYIGIFVFKSLNSSKVNGIDSFEPDSLLVLTTV